MITTETKFYKLLGKVFIFCDEEWIVDEVPTIYYCVCRSLETDQEKQFRCELIAGKVKTYAEDLAKRNKKYNAIIIEEEDEKEFLKKVVQHYSNANSIVDISTKDLEILAKLRRKTGIE